MTNDSIIESTEDGSAGPTDLLTPEEIAIGAIGLVISTIGIIIAAYMCYKKVHILFSNGLVYDVCACFLYLPVVRLALSSRSCLCVECADDVIG